jgi:hypothetical protein
VIIINEKKKKGTQTIIGNDKMYRTTIQGKITRKNISKIELHFLLVIAFLLFFWKISSKTISFSYRTCLPNIDLIYIEHIHPLNSQQLQLITRDFHLHIIYTYQIEQYQFQFGNLHTFLSNQSNFDYQYQSAINYYHQIDTWNYVNLTFDDNLARIFISFQNKTIEKKFHVEILVNQHDQNVTCLLPYSGFEIEKNSYTNHCSTDIKTCG